MEVDLHYLLLIVAGKLRGSNGIDAHGVVREKVGDKGVQKRESIWSQQSCGVRGERVVPEVLVQQGCSVVLVEVVDGDNHLPAFAHCPLVF